MRPSYLSLTLAVLAAGHAVADTKVALDGKNAKVSFEKPLDSKKVGRQKGGFAKVSGTAAAKNNSVRSLKLEIEIDVTSLYSDDKKLTKQLLSPDFFDAKKHPKAKFVLTKVERIEGDTFFLTGDLTLRGQTKAISVAAEVTLGEDKLKLRADFTIKPAEWGMKFGKDDHVPLTVVVDAK
jgi:polyisoprenoid-binding protein YceI